MASRKSRKAGSRDGKRSKTRRVQRVSEPDSPRPERVEDLFGAGETGHLLQGRYQTDAVYAWFQKRHEKGLRFLDEDGYYRRNGHEWKVPYGVRYALTQKLLWAQMSNQYPWIVTWRSPKTNKRLFKKMMSLPHAIVFVAEKAQYVDAHATILCRHHMDIPPKLRNKIPSPWKWCPRCMKPRKFKRLYESTGDPKTFFATVKVWVLENARTGKGHYEYPERKLALMECRVCGCTNKDEKFRRSNQAWSKVKVKRGKTRMRRRKGR